MTRAGAAGAAGAAGKVTSGAKYRTAQGFSAIKDGIKVRQLDAGVRQLDAGVRQLDAEVRQLDAHARQPGGRPPRQPKPAWLRARMGGGEGYARVRRAVRDNRLATVCEESHCPNIGECWSAGTATLMLMGSVCTRACRFCAVDTGNPNGWLDPDEPANAARAVRLMALNYVVLTSVDRDDLPDGGAAHFAASVRAIKAASPSTTVEALTPDFGGDKDAVATVVDSGVDVFAQNLETVRRLTRRVRDPRAGYAQTLAVLRHAAGLGVTTKSGLMLGLGETDAEIRAALDDLRAAGVALLTLGQYLQPTRRHLPVARWVRPEEFAAYRRWGLAAGFRDVAAGPLVRSSYRADELAAAAAAK